MPDKKLKIQGRIWLETQGGLLIGIGRTKLLEKISECGSIAQAARKLNISYRQAWAMVKEINKSAGKIVVEKTSGGKNGGGAKITTAGHEIISAYKKLSDKFEKFKKE